MPETFYIQLQIYEIALLINLEYIQDALHGSVLDQSEPGVKLDQMALKILDYDLNDISRNYNENEIAGFGLN